jgi:hypothetical protein
VTRALASLTPSKVDIELRQVSLCYFALCIFCLFERYDFFTDNRCAVAIIERQFSNM